MTDTVVSQTREQVLNSDGELVYRVISVVTAKGDLPHPSLFVTTINDTLDPATDTFLRIATPYDLTNLETNRTAAVLNGATLYLSTYASNDFDALEIAMQARQEIDGRINILVTMWQTYYGSFYTPSAETLTFPNADEGYVQELKDLYAAAKAARIAAEAALEAQTEALSDAEEAYANATALADLFQTFVNYCDELRNATHGYWSILKGALTAYVGGNSAFFDDMKLAYEVFSGGTPWSLSTPPAPTDDWYPMYNAMVAWYSTIKQDWDTDGAPQVSNADSLLTTMCTTMTSEYASAVNDQTTALGDVNAATEAKEKATATLAAAQEAEDAALAAVVGVCPDFDPVSV